MINPIRIAFTAVLAFLFASMLYSQTSNKGGAQSVSGQYVFLYSQGRDYDEKRGKAVYFSEVLFLRGSVAGAEYRAEVARFKKKFSAVVATDYGDTVTVLEPIVGMAKGTDKEDAELERARKVKEYRSSAAPYGGQKTFNVRMIVLYP